MIIRGFRAETLDWIFEVGLLAGRFSADRVYQSLDDALELKVIQSLQNGLVFSGWIRD